MYRTIHLCLLPLMLLGVTLGENNHELIGFHSGQLLNWMVIFLAVIVVSGSRYSQQLPALLLLIFGLRALELLELQNVHFLRLCATGIIFFIAGSVVYGPRPQLLMRQLAIYLAFCIPVMILQITGVDSFFMSWNAEYHLDSTLMTLNSIGEADKLMLFPTLFVPQEQLVYFVAQGRPVGLLYSNNILSIFILFAVAMKLSLGSMRIISKESIFIALAAVLSMSKLALGGAIILSMLALIMGNNSNRKSAIGIFICLFLSMIGYRIFFPGLFEVNLSNNMILSSIVPRLIGIFSAFSSDTSGLLFAEEREMVGEIYIEGEVYSTIQALLQSNYSGFFVLLIFFCCLIYVLRMRQMKIKKPVIYSLPLIALILTQLAVPYISAPSFQLILGFSCFPLFKKLWMFNEVKTRLL